MSKKAMIIELLNDEKFTKCFYTETLETMNKRHITDIKGLYWILQNRRL